MFELAQPLPRGRVAGIYLITHRESGRKYVGQSVHVSRRVRQHAAGWNSSRHLKAAIALYGAQAFSAQVLEMCEPAALNDREQHHVRAHACMHPAGFNLTAGGEQPQEVSQDTRARLSQAQRDVPEELKARRVQVLRNMTTEKKAEAARARVGRRHSDGTKARMSASMTGVKRSEEGRAHISAAARNRSPEHIENLRAAAKARAAREGRGEENKARVWTPEMRANLSESMRRAHQKKKEVGHVIVA